MGKDTIADIITSIRNADMNRKGTVRIASTNITENVVKILLREGFIENARKLVENKNKKEFLVLTLRHRRNRKGPWDGDCNSLYFSGYNDRPSGSTGKNRWRNFVLYMVIILLSELYLELTFML
ncbi:30S ribosomal protein S8 [Citrus sinensis]|nr:30S ribosomal protein S8 [Citrus sinensis]